MSERPLVLVTGASSGIGAATATLLARNGYRVILTARTRSRLEEVAAGIAAFGGVAHVEPCDCGDAAAVADLAERVAAIGAPQVVVNSAGAGQWKYIEETEQDEGAALMAAPYAAAWNISRVFLPAMLAARRGQLIHINSPACVQPWAGSTGYAAARWALRGLHEALVQDLAGTGVISTHVIFGEVTSSYFEANPDSHAHLPKIAAIIPISSPEQCAEVILGAVRRPRREIYSPFMVWLLSQMAQYIPWAVRALVRMTGRKRS